MRDAIYVNPRAQRTADMANGEAEGSEAKEGQNLLGKPKFKRLETGRLKCVETGHELPAHAKESYACSKHCRVGLIDAALARNKPPLNMFRQDPQSSSKLICKLTGLTINKSEEHIWKHINGKRFLRMLEKMETEQKTPNEMTEEMSNQKADKAIESEGDGKKKKNKRKKKKKKKDKKGNSASKTMSEEQFPSGEDDNSEEEADFWMPPVGERWDFDEGGDRWGSGSESGSENDAESEKEDDTCEDINHAAGVGGSLKRLKDMSLKSEEESSGSRKKKKKTNDTS